MSAAYKVGNTFESFGLPGLTPTIVDDSCQSIYFIYRHLVVRTFDFCMMIRYLFHLIHVHF